jgi:hypothetical protein
VKKDKSRFKRVTTLLPSGMTGVMYSDVVATETDCIRYNKQQVLTKSPYSFSPVSAFLKAYFSDPNTNEQASELTVVILFSCSVFSPPTFLFSGLPPIQSGPYVRKLPSFPYNDSNLL